MLGVGARCRSWFLRAPGQLVEEVEAPPGERAVPPAFGEPGEMGAVERDEAVAGRDQRARLEVAVDETPPAERETLPGDGVLHQVDVVVVAPVAGRVARPPAFGGGFTGTPNVGFGLSDGGAREWRAGWRLTSAVPDDSGFEVSLDATRRDPAGDNEPPDHGVMLRGAIRW